MDSAESGKVDGRREERVQQDTGREAKTGHSGEARKNWSEKRGPVRQKSAQQNGTHPHAAARDCKPRGPRRLSLRSHIQLGVGEQLRGGFAHPAAAATAAAPPRPTRLCHARLPAGGGGHTHCRGRPAAGSVRRPPTRPVPSCCRRGGGGGDKGGRETEEAHRADRWGD